MASRASEPRRILVVLPNWVGDVVLATPALRALRAHLGRAHISYLLRSYVAEVVAGSGWYDASIAWPQSRGLGGPLALARFCGALRRQGFDLALLLTNSFRAALVAWLARIPRRVGYGRDGRSWLLTERLIPARRGGAFVPSSVLPYYLAIAEHIGCPVTDRRVTLACSGDEEAAAAALRRVHGLADGDAYAVINPGAAFGAAKCWLPERFAEVCDRLTAARGLRCVLVGAPHELPLLQRIRAAARTRVILFDNPGTTLGTLKPIMRDAKLLVCNDTGPRHYGNAFGLPTVTIFGPTDPAWTETDYADEIELQARVECGPCQLPRCPLDHRCMRAVTADHVLAAAFELLDRRAEPAGPRAATPA